MALIVPRDVHRLFIQLIVNQDATRRALKIIILTRPDRPDERGEAQAAKQQRNGNEDRDDVHLGPSASSRFNRSAFIVTSRDEDDIATAATSGVTKPAIAKGTAIAL